MTTAPLVPVRSATSLALPWAPSINGYWIQIQGKHAKMLSRSARLFRTEADEAIRRQLGGARPKPYTTPVRVDIELRVPDRRVRDIDNYTKGIFDALTYAGVWKDDSLVDELTIRRGRQIRDGAVLVLIAPLDPERSESDASEPAADDQERPF